MLGGINISTSGSDKWYKEKGKEIGEMESHCSVEGDQGRLPCEVTLSRDLGESCQPWWKRQQGQGLTEGVLPAGAG